MTFTPEQTAALTAPLNKSNVKERSQAGRSLSYIEAWHAIAEANRIFGHDGWDRETVELISLGEPRLVGDKFRVGYRAKVRIRVGTIVREGCGFGSGIDKDADQAHESALKEAESDAMKRALMTFGNPFGLALYDKAQANVEDDTKPSAKRVEQTVPTLDERADRLEAMLKGVKPEEVQKAWDLAAALLAQLSVEMPDRLKELTTLYEFRKPSLEAAA